MLVRQRWRRLRCRISHFRWPREVTDHASVFCSNCMSVVEHGTDRQTDGGSSTVGWPVAHWLSVRPRLSARTRLQAQLHTQQATQPLMHSLTHSVASTASCATHCSTPPHFISNIVSVTIERTISDGDFVWWSVQIFHSLMWQQQLCPSQLTALDCRPIV